MKSRIVVLFAAVVALVATSPDRSIAEETPFRLAWFRADVTVPMGHRLMGVLPVRAERVADPLEARGFVLLGPEEPIVWVAVDWCEIRNEAYQRWQDVLAAAANTLSHRVVVTCLHQHDAPVADLGAQRLLDEVGLTNELCDPEFHEAAVQHVADELRKSLARARPVTHVGAGQGLVRDVASSRRVVLSDRRAAFSRGSNSGGDPAMRAAPAGLIDPWLRTLSFWEGDKPLLAFHTYATHPMSSYGRGEVSADFVGLARRMRQQDDPEIFQIYASGCSGDVTAGKYNDGSLENRPVLAERLHSAMKLAWQNTRRWPLKSVELRSIPMSLPFRGGEEFTAAALQKALADPQQPERERILAAMGLASRQRIEKGHAVMATCLDFGRALMTSLPAESFVGYQLMALRLRPDVPVICAGYGECWPGYIPTRDAYAEGFTDDWLWVDRGADAVMRSTLIRLLRSPRVLRPTSSNDISHDVFVASAAHPRYSEGSILPLADGSLLFAVTEFDASTDDFAQARIVARRSHDGGATWGRPEVLQENVGQMNVMSATLRRLRSEHGADAFFYLVKNGHDDLKAYVRFSTDEMRSFGEPCVVTDAPGYHVLNNDRVTELADGRLLCPVAWSRDVVDDGRFESRCYWSDDGGQTWVSGPSSVVVAKRGAMEPEVLELDDGRVLMIVRTQLGEIYASYSTDRGKTWSAAEPWGVRSPEAPATLRRVPATGDLLLIWNPDYVANADHGGRRTPLVAAISQDEGRTWNAPRVLEERSDQQFAYTSVTFFEDRVLMSYYVDDDDTARITARFRSLPLSWFYEPETTDRSD